MTGEGVGRVGALRVWEHAVALVGAFACAAFLSALERSLYYYIRDGYSQLAHSFMPYARLNLPVFQGCVLAGLAKAMQERRWGMSAVLLGAGAISTPLVSICELLATDPDFAERVGDFQGPRQAANYTRVVSVLGAWYGGWAGAAGVLGLSMGFASAARLKESRLEGLAFALPQAVFYAPTHMQLSRPRLSAVIAWLVCVSIAVPVLELAMRRRSLSIACR